MNATSTSASRQVTDEFVRRATAVAARVRVVSGVTEAAETIASESDTPATRDLYVASSAALSGYTGLREALAEKGIPLALAEDLDAGSEGATDTAVRLAGGVGIIAAVAGVAETGSVLCVDETLTARLLGMLSDTVFVLLRAKTIVHRLDQLGDLLSKHNSEGCRYLSLVTGPSRSADIERALTIGVQGPKALHVVVLTDPNL